MQGKRGLLLKKGGAILPERPERKEVLEKKAEGMNKEGISGKEGIFPRSSNRVTEDGQTEPGGKGKTFRREPGNRASHELSRGERALRAEGKSPGSQAKGILSQEKGIFPGEGNAPMRNASFQGIQPAKGIPGGEGKGGFTGSGNLDFLYSSTDQYKGLAGKGSPGTGKSFPFSPPPGIAALDSDSILHQIRAHLARGKNVLTIQLEPPELGSVRIKLSLVGNKLAAKFDVSRNEVAQLLAGRQGELRAALNEAGIEVEDFLVNPGRTSHAHREREKNGFREPGREKRNPLQVRMESAPRKVPSSPQDGERTGRIDYLA